MSGSVRETLPDAGCGREATQMTGSGREILQDVREFLGVSLGCPGVVRRPSRQSGSGRETLQDVL